MSNNYLLNQLLMDFFNSHRRRNHHHQNALIVAREVKIKRTHNLEKREEEMDAAADRLQ